MRRDDSDSPAFAQAEASDDADEGVDVQALLSTVEACAAYLNGMRQATAGDARIAYLNYLIGAAAAEATRRAASLKRAKEGRHEDRRRPR